MGLSCINESKNKKKQREALAFWLCIYLIFGVGFAVHAEANPISIAAVSGADRTFTVVINAAAETDMQAFKYIINYNGDKVKVLGKKGVGYAFSNSFLGSYNANSGAALAYNNIADGKNSRLIFAGAQADTKQAVLAEDTQLCFITFQITDSSIDSMEQADIYLKVEQLKGTEGDLVAKYPDVFKESVLTDQATQSENNAEDSNDKKIEYGTKLQTDNPSGYTGESSKTGKKLTEDNGISGNAGGETESESADGTQNGTEDLTAQALQENRAIQSSDSSMTDGISAEGSKIDTDVTGSSDELEDSGDQSQIAGNGRKNAEDTDRSGGVSGWALIFIGLAAAGGATGYAVWRRHKKNGRKV